MVCKSSFQNFLIFCINQINLKLYNNYKISNNHSKSFEKKKTLFIYKPASVSRFDSNLQICEFYQTESRQLKTKEKNKNTKYRNLLSEINKTVPFISYFITSFSIPLMLRKFRLKYRKKSSLLIHKK